VRALHVALGVFGCLAGCTRAIPAVSAYEQPRLEPQVRVLDVHRVTGRVFGPQGVGPSGDTLAKAGPAEARLLWRNRWKWNNEEHHRGLNPGLRGGPTLGVGIPLGRGRPIAVEARCGALQYALPENRLSAPVPDAVMRERDNRVGVEGGLYLSIPIEGR
jgi:hypothetical protein